MALTPEDVVKKEFTKPKGFGRSGYDEIQVDDFLDEIVVELRRLNAENEDVTSKLEDCRRSKGVPGRSEADSGQGSSPASAVPALTPVGRRNDDADKTQVVPTAKDAEAAKAARADLEKAQGELRSAQGELKTTQANLKSAKDELTRTKAELDQAQSALAAAKKEQAQLREQQSAAAKPAENKPGQLKSGDSNGKTDVSALASTEGAAGVIALAQRVHDEHVREGETKRDRLISDAQAHHDKVIGEANAKRDELIGSAHNKHDELISAAQSRHDELINTAQSRHDELLSTGQSKYDELIRTGTEKSEKMVRDAEQRKNTILGELNSEREKVSGHIEQLRSFEGDYRNKLRGYIEQHLTQLDETAVDDKPKPKA